MTLPITLPAEARPELADREPTLLERRYVLAVHRGRASVRRLMPVERERLLGFPDGWTAHGIDDYGREVRLRDGQRFGVLARACPVPVMEWVARRLASVDFVATRGVRGAAGAG